MGSNVNVKEKEKVPSQSLYMKNSKSYHQHKFQKLERIYIHNSRNCSAVALPHASKPWLTSKIPQLYSDISLSHLSHIKSNLKII